MPATAFVSSMRASQLPGKLLMHSSFAMFSGWCFVHSRCDILATRPLLAAASLHFCIACCRVFFLVQRLDQKAVERNRVPLVWLKQDAATGLYAPSSTVWEESLSALVPIRTQQWQGRVRLLTLPSRILEIDID